MKDYDRHCELVLWWTYVILVSIIGFTLGFLFAHLLQGR